MSHRGRIRTAQALDLALASTKLGAVPFPRVCGERCTIHLEIPTAAMLNSPDALALAPRSWDSSGTCRGLDWVYACETNL